LQGGDIVVSQTFIHPVNSNDFHYSVILDFRLCTFSLTHYLGLVTGDL
jgi:hypothetical protein